MGGRRKEEADLYLSANLRDSIYCIFCSFFRHM
jgi:hypothetical protein